MWLAFKNNPTITDEGMQMYAKTSSWGFPSKFEVTLLSVFWSKNQSTRFSNTWSQNTHLSLLHISSKLTYGIQINLKNIALF